MINIEETRVKKLKDYLLTNVNRIITNSKINVNSLSKDINNFSLDKIPTQSVVEKWITGEELRKDVFSFRSRNEYSMDIINNIKNIGFFEKFESIINTNNKEGNLPNIEGIESIECLNCGTLINTNNNTCIMDIQIQIMYRYKPNKTISI